MTFGAGIAEAVIVASILHHEFDWPILFAQPAPFGFPLCYYLFALWSYLYTLPEQDTPDGMQVTAVLCSNCEHRHPALIILCYCLRVMSNSPTTHATPQVVLTPRPATATSGA
jgi:hypothetical protein